MTLVELLTVLVIVAILAGLALPSYWEHLRRADRAAAKTALLEDAQFLESLRTVSNRYDIDGAGNPVSEANLPVSQAPRDGNTARYTITLTNLTASTFTLTAIPEAGSAVDGDACGSFTLNERAQKGATGSAPLLSCWNK